MLKNLLMAFAVAGVCLVWISILPRNSQIRAEPPKLLRTFPVMGTIAEIQFYGDEKTAARAADMVQKKFTEVEKIFNIFDTESEVSQLNATAFEAPFICSNQLWKLMDKARFFHDISDGAFDVSAGPLMELWGFYKKRGELPKESEVDAVLERVGLEKIIFDDEKHSVKFTVPGMRLDFGGIAKGYAVDLARDVAKSAGVKAGIINLGGNLACLDNPPPKKNAYTVGIRDPFNKNNICGTIEILGKACSTSGNYERYVQIEGKLFTHIMNPKTGAPVEETVSVTVITDSACDADALSTSFFINGDKILQKVLRKYPCMQLLMISLPQSNLSPCINADTKSISAIEGSYAGLETEISHPGNLNIKKIGVLWPEKFYFFGNGFSK